MGYFKIAYNFLKETSNIKLHVNNFCTDSLFFFSGSIFGAEGNATECGISETLYSHVAQCCKETSASDVSTLDASDN